MPACRSLEYLPGSVVLFLRASSQGLNDVAGSTEWRCSHSIRGEQTHMMRVTGLGPLFFSSR
jgi:hypothetical protein